MSRTNSSDFRCSVLKYELSILGFWSQRPIRLIKPSKRGRLLVSKDGDLFAILPDPATETFHIVKLTKASCYCSHEEVWVGKGLSGEPLVDTQRLEHDNVLSLFVRSTVEGSPAKKNVIIIDFEL